MNPAYQTYLYSKFPGLLPTSAAKPTPLTERGIEAPDGWFYLIEQAFQTVSTLNVQVTQCKEKLGALTIYVSGADYDSAAQAIAFICAQSVYVCEFCGLPGQLDTFGTVMVTACPQHALVLEKRPIQWESVLIPHTWVGDTCRGCGVQGGLLTEQGLYLPQRNGRPASLDCRIERTRT